jgi:hypothetical protein
VAIYIHNLQDHTHSVCVCCAHPFDYILCIDFIYVENYAKGNCQLWASVSVWIWIRSFKLVINDLFLIIAIIFFHGSHLYTVGSMSSTVIHNASFLHWPLSSTMKIADLTARIILCTRMDPPLIVQVASAPCFDSCNFSKSFHCSDGGSTVSQVILVSHAKGSFKIVMLQSVTKWSDFRGSLTF